MKVPILGTGKNIISPFKRFESFWSSQFSFTFFQ
jgi:hypothetical protein